MPNNRREPEAIRRKRERRAPRSLEDIEREKNIDIYDINKRARVKKTSNINKLNFKNLSFRGFKSKKFGFKKVLSIIGIVIAAILLLGVVSLASFFGKIDNKDTIAASAPTGDSVNFLLLGMDIGDTGNAENKSIKRTDTIMLVNYNKNNRAVQVVSIPRDTLVTEGKSKYKINAAFIKGGDAKVKSVIEDMLSLKINYIVKIDYQAFRDFIDAIGGVKMDIDRDMIYDDDAQNLHINFKGGTTVQLDGKKAEEFFRWRKNNDGTGLATGDLGRIENQHKFIQKVVDKCKTPTIIFKLPKILNSIAENMDTNLKSTQMIRYGVDFLASSGIQMKTLEGTPKMIGGQSYFVFDEKKNKELLNSLESGKITGDKKSNSDSEASSIKSSKILVLNGTKINGLAGRVKTQLEVLGWKNIDTGNADSSDKTIIKTNDKNIKSALKKEMSGIDKFEEKDDDSKYSSYDVVIIVGKNYKKLGE